MSDFLCNTSTREVISEICLAKHTLNDIEAETITFFINDLPSISTKIGSIPDITPEDMERIRIFGISHITICWNQPITIDTDDIELLLRSDLATSITLTGAKTVVISMDNGVIRCYRSDDTLVPVDSVIGQYQHIAIKWQAHRLMALFP